MNKPVWLTAASVVALLLSGCGGEESAAPPASPAPSPPPTPSPSPPPVVSALDSNPTLLPDLTPIYNALCGARTNVQTATAANLSGHRDGKKDLVLTLWCDPQVGTIVNGPTLGGLIILKQESDGTFSLGTKDLFGVDFVTLDGGVGGFAIARDFNNDGYDEVVVAITGEDGRTLPEGFTGYNKRMLFLTSTAGGSYKIELIGHPSYNFHVFTVFNSQGGKDVMSTHIGYGGKDQAFRLVNNTWSLVNDYDGLPHFRGSFFSSRGQTDAADRAILTDNNTSLNLFAKSPPSSAWQKTEGTWSFANIRMAPFQSWNGDPGTMPIVEYNGNDYGFITFEFNCRLKLYPNDAGMSVFAVPAERVAGGYNGQFLVESSSDFIPETLLLFFNEQNQSLIKADVNLMNFDNSFRMFNFNCGDLNSDGYDDIFVAGLSKGSKPRILINNKSGGFSSLPASKIPYPEGLNYDLGSLLADINGDGNLDLFYWPVNGVGSLDGGVRYQMFQGLRPINSSDF